IWPPREVWLRSVRATFEVLVNAGASVAWIGLEGFFCDPPNLFDPAFMSGGVLAAMTSTGEFLCPLDPDEPVVALDDKELLRLREASEGLSNVD
ncbi:MAG: hypothetical protein KY439_11740, partial [Actinobacteria bacterium]|nr:hypothetical protein [Actinomycetota bacterium]